MTATKLSPWAAKRTGRLNKFYTRTAVGDVLVSELGDISPTSVLDLGAGEGSLATAVTARWPDCHFTTVDLDPTCVEYLHGALVAAGATDHEHRTLDVFDADLPEQLGDRQYDLAVCNPPFFRPPWKPDFADILQAGQLGAACPTVAEATAEIIFLAQNLRLLRSGGTIALIVPDGLATGWRATAFRKALLDHHTLRTVVQLPPYSFLDTEAYCFILVLTKGREGAGQRVKLVRMDHDSSLSEPIWIGAKNAETRLDYSYHALAAANGQGAVTLRDLGADIQRGSLSTIERKAATSFVFHTGDFPSSRGKVKFDQEIGDFGNKRLVIAQEGDILMARVDRYLHEKVTLVAKGKTVLTDCVYRIRVPEEHREAVYRALVSDKGRARVQAVTKGVGARLLGKGELLDLPLLLSD